MPRSPAHALLFASVVFAQTIALTACSGQGGDTGGDTDSTTVDATTVDATTVDATTSTTGATTTAGESESTSESTTTGGVLVDKRVFITSARLRGDLKTEGGGVDGQDGADRLCGAAAAAASLGGDWVAWVSTSTSDAITRLPSDARWTLIDGATQVFQDRLAISSGPAHAIDMTEAGVSLLPSADLIRVWTNTTAVGRNSTDGQNDACGDWTDQTGLAAVGVLFDPSLGGGPGLHWTDTKQPAPCGEQLHLYCFEI
ncbi:MAG: hypothetical protein IPK80_15455 [Nannocystis sp.]|nr:hypothetical protein [Nannocystis sp.]